MRTPNIKLRRSKTQLLYAKYTCFVNKNVDSTSFFNNTNDDIHVTAVTANEICEFDVHFMMIYLG